jgi:hypothetical protein
MKTADVSHHTAKVNREISDYRRDTGLASLSGEPSKNRRLDASLPM